MHGHRFTKKKSTLLVIASCFITFTMNITVFVFRLSVKFTIQYNSLRHKRLENKGKILYLYAFK